MEGLEFKITALECARQFLPAQKQEFADSMIKQFRDRGRLSDKQWWWVAKLTDTAIKPERDKFEDVGDFKKVIELFAIAKQHVRYPRIVLQVNTQPIALSLAGQNSKAPGTVNVTDGQPFGQNQWFGRVAADGRWEKSEYGDENPEVRSFLRKFAMDPAGMAKEFGKLTGRCCFCNLPLKDEKSTAAGFGPVCAKNYGLESQWKAAQSVLESV
jgi:hypothetical protein